MSSLRRQVLRKYKDILRLSKTWNASEEVNTGVERVYIREEARNLFRKNRKLSDVEEIKLCLTEANTRLEMAHHYKNPYPRPVNFAPGYVMNSRDKKMQVKRSELANPVYMHSQDK